MQYQFADLTFDRERGLSAAGIPLSLGRRETALLDLLLAADGRVVNKDTLAAALWPGQSPSDDSIAQIVRRLRRALEGPGRPAILQTVYGVGLRLAVPVVHVPRVPAPAAREASTPSLPSARSAAWTLLVSAREQSARRGRRNIDAARDAARRALELDPTCVEGWVAMAEFDLIRVVRCLAPARVAGADAVTAAARALALDGTCARALAVRGFVRATVDDDVRAGCADLRAAVAADGEHWLIRGLHAWVLLAAGRAQDALAEVEAVSRLNPWNAWLAGLPGQYALYAGRPAEALAAARQAASQFPDIDVAHFSLSHVASALGLHEEAIGAARCAAVLTPDAPLFHTALPAALARAGRDAEARRAISRIEAGGEPLPAFWLAPAWWALGEAKRAREMLALAERQGVPQRVYAQFDPRFAGLNRALDR